MISQISSCALYKVRAQPAAPVINSIKRTSCYHRTDGWNGWGMGHGGGGGEGAAEAWKMGGYWKMSSERHQQFVN